MKLQTKERDESRVRRTYDQAQTPMQRLLASAVLPPHKQHELLRITDAVDPLRLLTQLEHLRDAAMEACSHTRHGLCQSNAWFHAPLFRRECFTGEAPD
jgi:hypothetical protein